MKIAPPSEALTRIIESDQEVATVDKTTEVRNLLVEETADEPAMELAPGLAPISSTFQDQDSAASVQPTTPPLTMISLLNLASSVPSTHLESDARIFFAKHQNMLDDSLQALPGCSQQPTVKNECIASSEEQARSLAESSRTSKNALSQYNHRSDALEMDKQDCDHGWPLGMTSE
ncbi:hypothetical protein Pint_25862 [Pistacia integerrima]|uniref:Uncharacterized protein n=1 Tax=Pistacia integerrima TaxID=434235 RepID=A0ACC0YBE6_9ROSI|nr:hypothetical protein Pint_25862 [Pistacia integerrima]